MSNIKEELDYIFKPRSIAVIGASDKLGKWGNVMVSRPLNSGYTGKIYPVNPRADTILGLPSYSSIKDIASPVDLAVITLPASEVPSAMRECAEKGVKGAILISAGFGETGSDGKKLEEKVLHIAQEGGIRFVGPNCMGIWSCAGNLNNAFNKPPKAGQIAFISQSGTFGAYMSEIAGQKGYGLRTFVSIGNQADLTAADYIDYLAQDDGTRAIILYMEGVKNGNKFFQVCKDALKKKPIILYKGGRSPAGARATISHTASIAGSEIIFQNMCRQLGLIRARESFHTFEMAIALLGQPLPRGHRIGIMGSGGQAVVATDECQELGLDVPRLTKGDSDNLTKMLPAHAPPPNNPVDFAGSGRTALDEANMVEELLKLDYIDGIISNVPVNPMLRLPELTKLLDAETLRKLEETVAAGARKFCELPLKYNKPVVCVRWSSDLTIDPMADQLRMSGIPVYDTPEQCARAMYALTSYAHTRRTR